MPSLPPHPTRFWQRVTSLPWCLPLVLAALLALDACSRPHDPTAAFSDFGLWLNGQVRYGRNREQVVYPFVVVKGPDGVDRFDPSPLGCFAFEGEVLLQSWLTPAQVRRSGAWGVTQRTTLVRPPDEFVRLPPDQRARLAQLMDEHLAETGREGEDGLRRAAQMLRDGTYTITEVLPSGYIHNALAITLALAFLWSCTLGRPWRSWAAMRRDYHLAHALCPRCRYPVHGYPGTTCPECGHDWGDPADHSGR